VKHRRIGGAITLVAILASPAPAQASDGLSLTIDGTTLAFLPQMDGGRTGFTRFLSVDAISIEGENGPARLVVELALPPGARNGDQPHDARISYRPDGWRDYWVSPLAFPPGAVVIEDLDLSGTAPRIAGHFAVPLCFTASPVHTPDPNRCLAASGRFATPLVRD
jgi:hypothetical protein